jgi:hypothetical protein
VPEVEATLTRHPDAHGFLIRGQGSTPGVRTWLKPGGRWRHWSFCSK